MSKRSMAWLAAALALAGCAGSARYPTSLAPPARSVVVIENHNWATARVYAVLTDGRRWRIATVETETMERIPLAESVDRTGHAIGFDIELIGRAESYHIDSVLLSPGQRMKVIIQNALSLSSIMVLP